MQARKLLKATWSALWRITTFLIVWGVLLGPILVLASESLESRPSGPSPLARLGLEVAAAVTVIAAAALVLRFLDRLPFGRLGLGGRRSGPLFGAGLAIGVGIMTAAIVTLWLLGVASFDVGAHPAVTTLALAGGAVFLNSVTQEVLVQGYVLQTIERQSSPLPAVLIASALFTLLHGPAILEGGLAALNLYLAGLLLGTAFILTRSLWLPIGIHFGWNFVQGPLSGLAVSGQDLGSSSQLIALQGPRWLTGGTFGLEGGIVATAVTSLGIVIVVSIFGIRDRRAESPAA